MRDGGGRGWERTGKAGPREGRMLEGGREGGREEGACWRPLMAREDEVEEVGVLTAI